MLHLDLNLSHSKHTFIYFSFLKFAISELDTRAMSPDKRMFYEITLSNNAEAIRQENEKVEKAARDGEEKGKIEGILEGKLEGKIEIILALIKSGMALEQIATVCDMPLNELEKLMTQYNVA